MTLPSQLDVITDALVDAGYAIIPDFMNPSQVSMMVRHLERLQSCDQLQQAGVGQGAERVSNTVLRGDSIHWVDQEDAQAGHAPYLLRLKQLKSALNRSLSLGLFEFEGHYAIYPAGSFYRKHLDQFQHDNHRTLTCILYLNENWKTEDGGMLRLYLDDADSAHFIDIAPVAGTLVTFLSSRFWHEVLPARRVRMSLTGWYKTRTNLPF